MIPRVGTPPRQEQAYRQRAGAYALLPRNGRILLTFQNGPEPEYQLPGGGIDPGEHMIPALHREVIEETGWTIHKVRRLRAFRRFVYMPDYDLMAEKLCHIFRATPALKLGPPSEPDHSAIWATPYEALDLLGNAGDRLFLVRVIAIGLAR